MNNLIFITGGAGSGKSIFAEKMIDTTDKVIYIATAIAIDNEMKNKIEIHKSRRNTNWITIEAYKDIDNKIIPLFDNIDFILIDCITVMITNILLFEKTKEWEKLSKEEISNLDKAVELEIDKILYAIKKFNGKVIIVSNEVGMGLVPDYKLGRIFRDIAGKTNQKIALEAEEVYFIVSGIPVKIKG